MSKAGVELMVEGKNINDMQWGPLQKHVVEMVGELLIERGERTKSRKECDVIRTFWQNTETEFKEAKANLMKKYLEVNVIWDQYKEPYEQKELEITYQNFILNYDTEFQEKERKKRADVVCNKWNNEVLPKMMELKSFEAHRFDTKQVELNKEYKEAEESYKKEIDEAVKKSDDRIKDWKVVLYQRTLARVRYFDLQFLLEKFFTCEQKNLLIHDLKAAHKVNFEKIRTFIRERIEGDTMQIMSLGRSVEKENKEYQRTKNSIDLYKEMLKQKEDELNDLNRSVKLCELRLNSYKQNIDVANRCGKKIGTLNKVRAKYEVRKKELEEEIKRRQKQKQLYLNLLREVKDEAKKLQKKYLGDVYGKGMVNHMDNLKEFDNLFEEFAKKSPESAREAKKLFYIEKSMAEQLPLLVTKEIKSHNDFMESAIEKLNNLGISQVPNFVRITNSLFPTGPGPAGLTNI